MGLVLHASMKVSLVLVLGLDCNGIRIAIVMSLGLSCNGISSVSLGPACIRIRL